MSDLALSAQITANGQSAVLSIEDNPSIGIEITGTWTGTLVVQATIDGTHWFTPIVSSPTGGSGTSTFTGNGRTIATCPGAALLQVIATAAITGAAVVVLRAGNATGVTVAAGLELPTTLNDLSDVTITSPAVKQALRYSGSEWVNSQLALNDLSDVSVGTPAQGAIAYRGAATWNALAAGAAGQVLESNGAAANPSWVTATLAAMGDVLITSAAQGNILYRGAATWNNMAPGTAGFVLQTQGAGANPTWAQLALTNLSDVSFSGVAQGQIPYRGAATWNNLAVGTAGQVLQSGGAAANPSWLTLALNSLSDVLLSGVAQGDIPYRGASKWNNLATGTAGQFLKANGASANPSWATLALSNLTGDVTLSGTAQGDVLYRGASAWNNLPAGASGQVLTSGGASANPSWATPTKRSVAMCLMAGFSPAATGGDAAEYKVPFSPVDGTTSITWNVRRIDFRVSTAGGAPQATVEKYTGSSAFAATTVGSVTLGSGANEGSKTSSFTTSTLASGDSVRVNANALATAAGWTVILQLESST